MLFKRIFFRIGISHFLYVAIVNFDCLELPVGLDLKNIWPILQCLRGNRARAKYGDCGCLVHCNALMNLIRGRYVARMFSGLAQNAVTVHNVNFRVRVMQPH